MRTDLSEPPWRPKHASCVDCQWDPPEDATMEIRIEFRCPEPPGDRVIIGSFCSHECWQVWWIGYGLHDVLGNTTVLPVEEPG